MGSTFTQLINNQNVNELARYRDDYKQRKRSKTPGNEIESEK